MGAGASGSVAERIVVVGPQPGDESAGAASRAQLPLAAFLLELNRRPRVVLVGRFGLLGRCLLGGCLLGGGLLGRGHGLLGLTKRLGRSCLLGRSLLGSGAATGRLGLFLFVFLIFVLEFVLVLFLVVFHLLFVFVLIFVFFVFVELLVFVLF